MPPKKRVKFKDRDVEAPPQRPLVHPYNDASRRHNDPLPLSIMNWDLEGPPSGKQRITDRMIKKLARNLQPVPKDQHRTPIAQPASTQDQPRTSGPQSAPTREPDYAAVFRNDARQHLHPGASDQYGSERVVYIQEPSSSFRNLEQETDEPAITMPTGQRGGLLSLMQRNEDASVATEEENAELLAHIVVNNADPSVRQARQARPNELPTNPFLEEQPQPRQQHQHRESPQQQLAPSAFSAERNRGFNDRPQTSPNQQQQSRKDPFSRPGLHDDPLEWRDPWLNDPSPPSNDSRTPRRISTMRAPFPDALASSWTDPNLVAKFSQYLREEEARRAEERERMNRRQESGVVSSPSSLVAAAEAAAAEKESEEAFEMFVNFED